MGSTNGMVLYFKKIFCQAYFFTLPVQKESKIGLFSYKGERNIPSTHATSSAFLPSRWYIFSLCKRSLVHWLL